MSADDRLTAGILIELIDFFSLSCWWWWCRSRYSPISVLFRWERNLRQKEISMIRSRFDKWFFFAFILAKIKERRRNRRLFLLMIRHKDFSLIHNGCIDWSDRFVWSLKCTTNQFDLIRLIKFYLIDEIFIKVCRFVLGNTKKEREKKSNLIDLRLNFNENLFHLQSNIIETVDEIEMKFCFLFFCYILLIFSYW